MRDTLVRATWFDESHTLLLLSPAIIRSLPLDSVLECIDGSSETVEKVCAFEDGAGKMDTRYGVTAFGFRVPATAKTAWQKAVWRK